MASKMIGRAACPECGFHAAHVKQSEKCIYRYCPECNSQHYAKSETQRANLLAKTRLLSGTGTDTEPEPAAAPATDTGNRGSGTDAASMAGGTGSGTAAPTTTTTAAPVRRHRLFG